MNIRPHLPKVLSKNAKKQVQKTETSFNFMKDPNGKLILSHCFFPPYFARHAFFV
jgi:hypothetical protein